MTLSAKATPKEILDYATRIDNGIPYPDWGVIHEWSEAHIAKKGLNRFYTEIASVWAESVADAFGEDYIMLEGDDLCMISGIDEATSAKIFAAATRIEAKVAKSLDHVRAKELYGCPVVMLMRDSNDYWRYVSHFHPEETERPPQGGCFINEGYGHIVLYGEDERTLQITLAHEFTHSMLMHRAIPRWLDEGLAQEIEVALGFSQPLQDRIQDELAEKHFAFWNRERIVDFWKGKSFERSEEAQKLSYSLSHILLNLIMTDVARRPEDLRAFVNEADAGDAGQKAARENFGQGMGEIAEIFLGQGDWDVPPDLFPESEAAAPPDPAPRPLVVVSDPPSVLH